MSKLNIIIDGNYQMHRTLHTYEQLTPVKLDSEEDCGRFIRKLATDLCYTLRCIGRADRIIWTIDCNSWRKKIDIDQNDGYKKNRSYSDDVNWENFSKLNKEFGKILEDANCISTMINGMEGDDLMYFWSNKFFEDEEDTLILTGDRDITQLVKCNDKNFICVYNDNSKSHKLTAANGFLDYIYREDEVSLFDLDAALNNKKVMKEFSNREDVVVEEIDPEDVIYEKIVSGDSGDNVPPIVTWTETQKTGKTVNRKITEKKAQAIKDQIILEHAECDISDLSQYADIFTKQIKEKLKQEIDEDIVRDRLKRNTLLVWLDKQTIPAELQEAFIDYYEERKTKGKPTWKTWRSESVLEGTKYYQEKEMIDVQSDYFKIEPVQKKEKVSKKKTLVDDDINDILNMNLNALF